MPTSEQIRESSQQLFDRMAELKDAALRVKRERDRFEAALRKIANGQGHYGLPAREHKEIAHRALLGAGETVVVKSFDL